MRRISLLVVGVLAALLIGCQKGNFSQSEKAGKENVFRYPIVTNPTSLDPGIVQDGDTIDLLQQVFEGLVTWSPQNTPEPALAEKWDISKDGKAYTFHLRHGVKFHNGREVKAADFKYTIERNCARSFNSQTAENYLGDIVGVHDKLQGKVNEVKGVKVIDDYTLELDIDQPRAYFLSKLTYPVSFPVAKEAVKEGKEISGPAEMIGAGPYKVVSYVPQQMTVLESFKDYWGGKPPVDKIERPVIKDPATRLNKFKSGEVDLVPLERQDVKGVQEDAALKDQLKFFDRPSIFYLGFNLKQYPPFADKRVRQAFTMAIDTNEIVDKYLGGQNKVASGILPPGVIGFREKTAKLAFDPAQAKKLLADAGFPDGKGLPKLEMFFREQRPDIQIAAEAMAGMLKKNLNVEVSLKTQEWRKYLEDNNKNLHPFFHMRWAADYLDPQNFLSLLLTTKGNENHTYYSNPEVDALCGQADVEMDQAKRLTLYAKAEDIILQDAAWAPIYFQRDAELISPRVTGLRESLFGHLPHKTVKLTR